MNANVKRILFVVFLALVFVPSLEGQVSVGGFGVFPQWACGGGYSSEAQLRNLGKFAVGTAIKFFNSDGISQPLTFKVRDANGTRIVVAPEGTVDLTIAAVASVTTMCEGSQVIPGAARFWAMDQKVTGTLTFTSPYGGTTISTSVNVEPWRRGHSLFVNYAKTPQLTISTGMAIANVEQTPNNVRITLYDSAKTPVGTYNTTLPPYGNLPKFVEEIFPQIKAMSEFNGVVNIDSGDLTAVMGIKSTLDERGFRMDNFPSSPAMDTVQAAAVSRVVCVTPSDIPEDPDCPRGLGQVAKNALLYWDGQMSANNQGSFTQRVTFLYDLPTNQIHVDTLRGKKTSAEYRAESSIGFPSIAAQLREEFPGVKHFLVWPGPDWSGDVAILGSIGYIGGPTAGHTTWRDFHDPTKFLATEGQKWSTTIRGGVWQNTFCYAVHEIGHMVGLSGSGTPDSPYHSLTMEQQYSDVENAMRGAMPGMIVQSSKYTCPGIMREIFGRQYENDQPVTKQVVVDGKETMTWVNLHP